MPTFTVVPDRIRVIYFENEIGDREIDYELAVDSLDPSEVAYHRPVGAEEYADWESCQNSLSDVRHLMEAGGTLGNVLGPQWEVSVPFPGGVWEARDPSSPIEPVSPSR